MGYVAMRWRTARVLVAVGAGLVVAGCHDPHYQESSAERQERLAEGYARVRATEAQRSEHMELVLERAQVAQQRSERHLNETAKRIERAAQRDLEAWQREQARRERLTRDWLEGDLDNIPLTWGRLTY